MHSIYKQLSELQEIIDLIEMTAKLIGYVTESESITRIRRPQSHHIDYMNFLVYITPHQKVRLRTTYLSMNFIFNDEPHEEKIEHLQKLLRQL